MKDFYDLWAIPRSQTVLGDDLASALSSTFERRETNIPTERPVGFSAEFSTDPQIARQWQAYTGSIDLDNVSLEQVVDEVWNYLGPVCQHIYKLRN